MHLLTEASLSDIPRQVLTWSRLDEWNRVMEWPESPSQRVLAALLAMEAGYVEGLQRMLAQGLPATQLVPAVWLRDKDYKTAGVPLLRLAAELAHPQYRDPSVTPMLRLLTDAGAKPTAEVLGVVMRHDDHAAAAFLCSLQPALLGKIKDVEDRIRSVDMLQWALPQLSTRQVEGWLWRIDMEERGAEQVPAMIALLAARGFDLDVPTPYQPHQSREPKSVLEYHMQAPLLVKRYEHPLLKALIEHGARVDRLDLPAIHEHLPDIGRLVAARLAEQDASALQATTLAHQSSPRPLRF